MFMPKKNRLAIYSYLFKEGVLTCQKDPKLEKHHILDIPNIHVLDALKSLKSRKLVREVFNWQWHYFFLEDDGVTYLRQYLHLDEHVVPHTLKKPARPATVRGDERPFGGRGFGRGGFDKEKSTGPSGEFKPRFAGEGGYRREGGFGRGPRAAPAAEGAAPAAAQ